MCILGLSDFILQGACQLGVIQGVTQFFIDSQKLIA